MENVRKLYTTPRLTTHGTLEDVTKQEFISKTWGAADFVLLDNQQVLRNVS